MKKIAIEKLTARELVKILLDNDLDWEIEIRGYKGRKVKNASICIKEPTGFACLFG